MKVVVYTSPDCRQCSEVLSLLEKLTPAYELHVAEVSVLSDPVLQDLYGGRTPVIEGERLGRLYSPIDEGQLRVHLEIARRALPAAAPSASRAGGRQADSALDRLATFISSRWLRVSMVVLGIYVGLPWLAPVFAALGWWSLADPIYSAYAFT